MKLFIQLAVLKAKNPDKEWMIHNGYFGHSYGSPLNPIIVDQETINYLANQTFQSTGQNPADKLDDILFDCIYTDRNSNLFKKTFENRIFGLHKKSECIFENEIREITFEKFGFSS